MHTGRKVGSTYEIIKGYVKKKEDSNVGHLTLKLLAIIASI